MTSCKPVSFTRRNLHHAVSTAHVLYGVQTVHTACNFALVIRKWVRFLFFVKTGTDVAGVTVVCCVLSVDNGQYGGTNRQDKMVEPTDKTVRCNQQTRQYCGTNRQDSRWIQQTRQFGGTNRPDNSATNRRNSTVEPTDKTVRWNQQTRQYGGINRQDSMWIQQTRQYGGTNRQDSTVDPTDKTVRWNQQTRQYGGTNRQDSTVDPTDKTVRWKQHTKTNKTNKSLLHSSLLVFRSPINSFHCPLRTLC